MRLIPI
jgi:hypothetical protein